jgi:glycine oxidase
MIQANATAELIVVGGGVIGLSVARAVARKGVSSVMLIDRAGLGNEASFAAAGMLAPQAEADRADDFFKLACQSRDMYSAFAAALEDESGIDIELDTSGTIYLAFTNDDLEEVDQRYEWQTSAGFPVEKLNAEELNELEPCLANNVRAALKFPLDWQVENRRLLVALATANQKLGVRVVTGTTVESLRTERDRITGIETSDGFVSTQKVVIAGGAWTDFIKARGIPRLSIQPVRGQMICFETSPRLARHVIYSPRGYLVPRRDGRLLAGSTTENAGFDKRVTARGLHSILSNALEISSRVGNLPLINSWAGLRPRSGDNLPVLGRAGAIEGLYYATGHYRNGILLAPITGELLADLIVDNVGSPWLESFGPHRFDPVSAY